MTRQRNLITVKLYIMAVPSSITDYHSLFKMAFSKTVKQFLHYHIFSIKELISHNTTVTPRLCKCSNVLSLYILRARNYFRDDKQQAIFPWLASSERGAELFYFQKISKTVSKWPASCETCRFGLFPKFMSNICFLITG